MTTIAKGRLEKIAKELRLSANKNGIVTRTNIEAEIGLHAGINWQTIKQYLGWLIADGVIKETRDNPNLFKIKEGVKDGKKAN